MTIKNPAEMKSRTNSSEKIEAAKPLMGKVRLLQDIMSKNLRTIHEDATVAQVRKTMVEHHIRHILVVESGSNVLKGILSDRDVRAIVSPFVGTPEATERDNATMMVKVRGIMKKSPYVAKADDSVRKAVEIMLQKRVGCVPIVDSSNKPVGVVSSDDVLREMLNLLP
jgi:acetoin utilization protein AcuB